jgi:hypothetical protein
LLKCTLSFVRYTSTAFFIAAGVAVVVLWAGSYRFGQCLNFPQMYRPVPGSPNPMFSNVFLSSAQGRLQFEFQHYQTSWIVANPRFIWGRHLRPDRTITFDVLGRERRWDFVGFTIGYEPPPYCIVQVVVPDWAVVAVCWLLPIFIWLRPPRHSSRGQGHFCDHCGYDLQASPNTCPECGRVPKKGQRKGNKKSAISLSPRS